MTLSRLTARAVTLTVAVLLAVAGTLLAVSPAYAATASLVRQPAPPGQAYYTVKVTVVHTTSAPATRFRLEFDLPAGTSVIPFSSLAFTPTGTHWVADYASSSPQTAGVRHTTSFAVLGSQNPTNVRIDGAPASYTVLTDTQAPTTPSNVAAARFTFPGVGTGVTLRWSASADDFGVTGYDITVDGQPYATTTNLSYAVPNHPTATTTYAVRARDAVGNASAYGTAVLPPQ